MTTIVTVIATVWAFGALTFFAALCLAAKRQMPEMESMDDATQFYAGHSADLSDSSLSENVRPMLGSATPLFAAKGNRA